LNADPSQYPGEIIEKDLASGAIDVAIVWGPIAGYFAKRVKSPRLSVVLLKSEPDVQFDYEMAMGVRYGEREWKQQVEALIKSNQAEIKAILQEFGVPLVADADLAKTKK
jgi:ABC-type amino acid transport substrate-binding protein